MVRRLSDKGNAVGWNDLPNELLHNVIVHAVADEDDTGKAIETFTSLTLTNKNTYAHMTDPMAMRDFEADLIEARGHSNFAMEFAVNDKEFSTNPVSWANHHIGNEIAAILPALKQQSPAKRSETFDKISKQAPEQRMTGYKQLLGYTDLFKQDEMDQMFHDALHVFQQDRPDGIVTGYFAAHIVAAGYDRIGQEARSQVERLIEKNPTKRTQWAGVIAQANPSLLERGEFRSLVRGEIDNFDAPHNSIDKLASYIDKNDEAATDFIIKKSLSYFGQHSTEGDGSNNRVAAAAIAKVYDGKVSETNKAAINALKDSNLTGASALKSALENRNSALPEPRRGDATPPRDLTKTSAEIIADLAENYEPVPGVPVATQTLEIIENFAKTNDRQTHPARKALMDTIREPRGR